MILVRRNCIPALLTNAPLYKNWTNRIKALLETPEGKRNLNFSPDSPRRIPGFMDALGSAFSNKCAYCEVKLNRGHEDTLSFFRPPKDACQTENGIQSPEHYWWLSWEWLNIYLACPACIHAKGRQFPTSKTRAQPGTYGDDLKIEGPLLLDPCMDASSSHLIFEEDGSVAARNGSERGKITIETLKLYREALIAARRVRAQEAKNLLREAIQRTNNYQGHIDNDTSNMIEKLKYLCGDTQEFAGMMRQLLGDWINTEMPAVLLKEPHWHDLSISLQSFQQESPESNSESVEIALPTIESLKSSIKAEPLIDFGIVTAIEVERLAVCKAFKLTDKDRVPRGARQYWRGRLLLDDRDCYEIVVTQLPDMANVDSAIAANDMIHHWNPGAILMVGIAAAATEEQELGDAAIGSEVYYYERGKVRPDGVRPEPKIYKADATLLSHVMTVPKWTARLPVPRPDKERVRPKIHYGVIASGERVIADKAVRDEVAAKHRKIIAIEMEGYGVSAACWQSFDRVRYLIIRAICDLADFTKNDIWHQYAAAVAGGFAKHFLLDRPLEPRNPRS